MGIYINKKLLLLIGGALCVMPASAAEFENAQTAVNNMRIGWNLGNTLDSNSGDTQNMWIEQWSDCLPSNYETAWGQPIVKPETIRMFKEAGFNAIRVPVTWYPHIGNTIALSKPTGKWDMSLWEGYDVDAVWMARVKEVVDYVVGEGMYCILNVHHDTGDSGATGTAWLKADMESYNQNKDRFESLWTQIANEFRDYDEHLVFEGYNEMLDKYNSWCFASFAAPGNYNKTAATDAYKAINSYAQSFVNVVRATGGNNAERNLIVSTYGACNGSGSWSSHLDEPLINMELPQDTATDHIIFEVHSYFDVSNLSNAKKDVDASIADAKKYLISKGAPVIFGEWGTTSDIDTYRKNLCDYARYYTEKCKEAGMGMFYWMTLSDGADRSVPTWTTPDLKDAIVKGYYGEEGFNSIASPIVDASGDTHVYNLMGIPVTAPFSPGIYIRSGKKFIVR